MAVFVAGHRGLLGSALVRALDRLGTEYLITDIDLREQNSVNEIFRRHRPETVYLAAARCGGIAANIARPWDFIADNLEIQAAVLSAANSNGCQRLVFFGSSCIYPRVAVQPLLPSQLMTGALEPTNAAYAMAKLAGIWACKALRTQNHLAATVVIPCNLYGPGDRYGDGCHVIPALIGRMHRAKLEGAKTVTVWGTGRPRREFLHADDAARAALLLCEHAAEFEVCNVGAGEDLSIAELAMLVAQAVGYRGVIELDPHRPDGVPGKLLDSSHIAGLGWRREIGLADGLATTYADFCQRLADGSLRT